MRPTQDTFSTSGAGTWTCPANVHGVFVECWGEGGSGSSGFGGGSGAYVWMMIDTVPGHAYSYFVDDNGGSVPLTWFSDKTLVAAAGGADGDGSSQGAGGSFFDSAGSLIIPGNDGAGASGGSAISNARSITAGAGGAASGGGGPGKIIVTYWDRQAGNGGGGGGGYANKTITVSPGTPYDLYVGHYGWGQISTISAPVEGFHPPGYYYSPQLNGESSWFQSSDTVRGAGGDSAGSADGDTESALALGAKGGGQSGAASSNVGDVTFKGGNGGDGNGISRYFGLMGGGGGSSASHIRDGNDGHNGAQNGVGGNSVNNFNWVGGGSVAKRGQGGNCIADSGDEGIAVAIHGQPPGGAGGGDSTVLTEAFTGTGEAGSGAAGRVVLSGLRSGQLLIPGF